MRNLIFLLVFFVGCTGNKDFVKKKEVEKINSNVKVLESKIDKLEERINDNAKSEDIKILEKKIMSLETMLDILSNKLEDVKDIKQQVKIEQVIPKDYIKKTEVEKKYQKARKKYLSREYLKALADFKSIINDYPQHKLAANSQYWRGECFYDQENYSKAIDEFQKVIDFYPNSNKLFDSYIKISLSLKEKGKFQEARHELEYLIKKMPNHSNIQLAKKLLKEL